MKGKMMEFHYDDDGNLTELPDPNRELKLRVGEYVYQKNNPALVGRITEIRWDLIIGVLPNRKPFTWMIGKVARVTDPMDDFFER